MSIRRNPARGRYTIIGNDAIGLSFGALGLLCYVLSKPDNWTVRTADVMARGGIGRGAYTRMMDELSAAGYAKLIRTKGPGGKATGSYWDVSEVPTVVASEVQGNGVSENPTSGKPDSLLMTDVVVRTETAVKTFASPSSAKPKAKGATREPRPLFDAFKGSFPTAPDSVAGRFDKECNRLGYTLEQWRRFMADRETADQLRRGFITQNTALGRFAGWIAGNAKPAARVQAPRPSGAPDHWRDLIYTHDGTRKAPALILPALGLDRYAPPDQWPEWLRSLESEGVMV